MRRLSLHIGSHKTGTTTLQQTFRANEARLLEWGISFAQVPPMPNLHAFLHCVTARQIVPEGFKVADPARLADFLGSYRSDHVFGSSENFSFFFHQAPVDALARELRRVFDEISIIVYLRRQDRHAVSHHQEGAKPDRPHEALIWGNELSPLPEPNPHQRLYLDYDRRIGLWENAFGAENLIVRVFDTSLLIGEDVVTDAFSLLGYKSTDLQRHANVNTSLGRVQAKIGHLANAALADDSVTQRLLDAFPWHQGRMAPSADAARAFLAPYVEGNRRLNERLGITGFDNLFPDDFSDYPNLDNERMDDAEWADAMRTVIATLGRCQSELQALNADDLRKAAMAVQKFDAPSALRLINAAFSLRPKGSLIIKLKEELEARLRQPGGT